MNYNIYLDDIRQPSDSFHYINDIRYNKLSWTIVRSYDEFVKTIEDIGLDSINIISFDHDLADEHYHDYHPWMTDDSIDYFSYTEKTGYECAKWLCDYASQNNFKIPEILVHSFNHIGADNIKHYIKNFIKHNPELI